MSENPYKVIGVPTGTSLENCKKKAKQLLKRYHPDNGGDSVMFHKVQDAIKEIETNGDLYVAKKHLTHDSLFSFSVVQ